MTSRTAGPQVQSTKVKQLVNLLTRGRSLHYDNARKLIRLPATLNARADLVYRAMQITVAFVLMERRRYLDDREHDAFTDAAFVAIADPHGDRVMRLVEGYARAYADPQEFVRVCVQDLAAALTGEVREDVVVALRGTPAAVVKLTEFYVAQVFGDRQLMRERSA